MANYPPYCGFLVLKRIFFSRRKKIIFSSFSVLVKLREEKIGVGGVGRLIYFFLGGGQDVHPVLVNSRGEIIKHFFGSAIFFPVEHFL